MLKPEIELFREHDMAFEQRALMLKVNEVLNALGVADIIIVKQAPAKKKNIVCVGSESKNIVSPGSEQ